MFSFQPTFWDILLGSKTCQNCRGTHLTATPGGASGPDDTEDDEALAPAETERQRRGASVFLIYKQPELLLTCDFFL